MNIKICLLLFCFLFNVSSGCYCRDSLPSAHPPVQISGTLPFLTNGDSVQLKIEIGASKDYSEKRYVCLIKNKSFSFRITSIQRPTYINLIFGGAEEFNLNHLLTEAGDTFSLSFDSSFLGDKTNRRFSTSNIVFSSNVRSRFEFKKSLDSLFDANFRVLLPNSDNFIPTYNTYELIDSLGRTLSDSLGKVYRNRISDESFHIITIDFLSGLERGKYFKLINNYYVKDTRAYLPGLRNYDDGIWHLIENASHTSSASTLVSCRHVFNAVLAKYLYDSVYVPDRPYVFSRIYDFFKEQYHGELKDRLLTDLFYSHRSSRAKFTYFSHRSDNIIDKASCLEDALSFINGKGERELLLALKDGANAGAKAFNFELSDVDGNVVRLSDYKGKVVVVDFWFTGCGNCRILFPKLHNVQSYFRGNDDVVFLSISIDRSRNEWIKSVRSGLYTSPQARNLYTNGNGVDHQLIKHYFITAYPRLFLIGKDGRHLPLPQDPRRDGGKDFISKISELVGLHGQQPDISIF